MKKLDKNQKITLIACAVFIVFMVSFSILSKLAQNEIIPDFNPNHYIQGLLAFITFLPLLIAMFFAGKYFKAKNSRIGGMLTFVSIALFVFAILQVLLSLLGVYGS